MPMFLAREIFELEKCKLDGRPSGFGIPYRFYVGIKTEFFDFIEQNRTFDSLGEDLGLPFCNSHYDVGRSFFGSSGIFWGLLIG